MFSDLLLSSVDDENEVIIVLMPVRALVVFGFTPSEAPQPDGPEYVLMPVRALVVFGFEAWHRQARTTVQS